MNDNLSGNPAMPSPTGTTVPDREGITDSHPSALLAAGMEITDIHPCALLAVGMGITDMHPSALPAEGMGITDRHPSAIPQQEWKSQAATRLPASNNNRYRQTAVKAALAIFLFI